jgi:hypothetical protein
MIPPQNINRVLCLMLLLGILSAIAIYRIGFHKPVPGFNEEAMKSLQAQPQELQTKPSKSESPASVDPPQSVLQPSHSADSSLELPTQGRYRSQHPLYFRVVFGEQGNKSTLGVIDESGGTGTGYDVAYVDENRNGDLTDDAAKKFDKYDRGSRAGQINPTFKFCGPLKERAAATYSLNIYLLEQGARAGPGGDTYFFWTLDTDEWSYFFINGKIRLSSSAADALTGTPVRLAGPCKWEINSQTRDDKSMISAGLKDENGCTLRIVRKTGQTISPTLTMMQDGKVKMEEKMQFG